MSCLQCELDIPHVCYAGIPNARWGLTDEAVMHLEAAERHLGLDLGLGGPRKTKKPKRRTR